MRGDIVTFSGPGDYSSKPRPAVVVQTDLLPPTESVLLCLLTSEASGTALGRRIAVPPTVANGLERPSFVMVEKIVAARRDRCRRIIGRIEPAVMMDLDDALALVLGLAD